ncbi:MAG: response regulator, partial [Gammaproteobacteria bacterium]|nr:response regulator [Gammaproteobacteria bacterium]
ILGQSFPINVGMCGWVLSNQAPLFFGENSQQLMGRDVSWKPGMESSLLTPLMSRGKIVGGLSGLGKEGGGSFTRDDQSMLELFAAHISIAIENAMIFNELKKQQFHLQSILSYTPAVIYIKDLSGKYLLINRRYEELFNISNGAIQGKTDYDIFPKEFADKYTAIDQDVLRSKKPVELEESAPQTDGFHIYLTIKFPLFDAENNVNAVCGISTDITEIRKTEDALRRAQKMDAIGKLTGGIAHDFNNQLGVVLGYLEMIKMAAGSGSDITRMIETANRATLRCTDLTRQLLSFSRKQTAELQDLNLNECLSEMNGLMAHSLTPEINITYDLMADLWIVRTNKGEFQDAVLNLAINARDAMPNGGELDITSRNVVLDDSQSKQLLNAVAGEYVKLTITDNGIGMSKEIVEQIYEPFFTTKPVGKGTGLGMAMVYGYIKRNNGLIEIHSEPGRGTAINIYLPRSVATTINPVLNNDKPAAVVTGNELVLVVDDESDLLELTVAYLRQLGYQTLYTTNPDEALNFIVANHDIKLLLTDLVMPGMNGYLLADKAQAYNPAIKVIFISGLLDKPVVDPAYKKYESKMLLKPFRKDTLAIRIRETLDQGVTHA